MRQTNKRTNEQNKRKTNRKKKNAYVRQTDRQTDRQTLTVPVTSCRDKNGREQDKLSKFCKLNKLSK